MYLKHYDVAAFDDQYDCNVDSPTYCTEPICSGGPNPIDPCPRITLDPCNYPDMASYAVAVACELNKQMGPCKLQEYPFGCQIVDKCFKNLQIPPDFVALYSGLIVDPFRYCSSASCGDYICTFGSYQIHHHLYISPAGQDILIDKAKKIAKDNLPVCGNGFKKAYVGNIFYKSCYDINTVPPGPSICGENTFFCTNMSLRLHVEYVCCPQ